MEILGAFLIYTALFMISCDLSKIINELRKMNDKK